MLPHKPRRSPLPGALRAKARAAPGQRQRRNRFRLAGSEASLHLGVQCHERGRPAGVCQQRRRQRQVSGIRPQHQPALRGHPSPRLPQVLQRHLQPAAVVPATLPVEPALQPHRGRQHPRRLGDGLRSGQRGLRQGRGSRSPRPEFRFRRPGPAGDGSRLSSLPAAGTGAP